MRRTRKLKHYQWKLDETARVTLDINGSGIVQLSPGGARERWVINFITVNTNGIPNNSINVPQLLMYRSAAVPGNQLGGTTNALLDTTTDVFELNMNEPIVFVISGGELNAVTTVHIEGIRHVWGN